MLDRVPPGADRLVDIDRELSSRGFYHFLKRAWPHVVTSPFKDGEHIRVLCSVCEDISHGRKWLRLAEGPVGMTEEVADTVVNVPPATGKSLITGVFWPMWDWIEICPTRHWMYASFDSSLLNGKSIALINLMHSAWLIQRWGRFLGPGRPNTSEIRTLQGGMKFNTSFGGKGTGRHCDIQVIDDPIKPRDASGGAAITGVTLDATWDTIGNTFASRARNPREFQRLMIMQRIHEEDPSGRALKAGWRGVRLPMRYEADNPDPLDWRKVDGELLFPTHVGEPEVDRLERSTGPDVWATQYQQRPSVPGGTIVKREWIEASKCTQAIARAKRGQVCQSWDLTFKHTESSDFVSGGHWVCTYEAIGGGPVLPHFWLMDRVNERYSFVETCNAIMSKRTGWPSGRILIEDKANGPACEDRLKLIMPGLIELVNPEGSKTARLHACAPLFANGQVHLPGDAPCFEALAATIVAFPRVRYDDDVDMVTQALLWLGKHGLFHAAMSNFHPGR